MHLCRAGFEAKKKAAQPDLLAIWPRGINPCAYLMLQFNLGGCSLLIEQLNNNPEGKQARILRAGLLVVGLLVTLAAVRIIGA